MAYDFDEISPADNDYISDFPGNERAARLAVKNAFEVEHELTNGFHDKVTLNEQGANPDPAAGDMAVYCKDSGGQPELFVQEENDGAAGDVIQITKGGYLHQVVSTLAAAPEAQRKMLANLLFTNALYIQGRDAADSEYLDLLQLDGSDFLNVGDAAAGSIQKVILKLALDAAGTPAENLLFNYGAGDKKIFHEGYPNPACDALTLNGGDFEDVDFSSTPYHQKFSSGLIMNWGWNVVGNNATVDAPLSKNYSAVHFGALCSFSSAIGTSSQDNCGCSPLGLDKVRIVNGAQELAITWISLGY